MADESGVPPETERQARERLRLQRRLFAELAEGRVGEAAAAFWRFLLTTPGLTLADLVEFHDLRLHLEVRAQEAFDRFMVPALSEMLRRGFDDGGFDVFDADEFRAFERNYIAGARSRVVGDSRAIREDGVVVERLTRESPIADELADQWRTTIQQGITYGWDTDTVVRHLGDVFVAPPDGPDGGWPKGARAQERIKNRWDATIDRLVEAEFPNGVIVDERGRYVRDARPGERGQDNWQRGTRNDYDAKHPGDPDPRMREATRERDAAARMQRKIEGDADASWRGRATRIARTESMRAYNAGTLNNLDQYQRANPDARPHKQWLATYDGRTRDSHFSADGQCVPAADKFRVGRTTLRFPGDQTGDPAETINCRCTMLTFDGPCDAETDTVMRDAIVDDPQSQRELDRRAADGVFPERADVDRP